MLTRQVGWWPYSKAIANTSRSKIPFYYADEATEAIKPLLGDLYHREDAFLDSLWPTFNECKYVVPDASSPGEMRWAQTMKDE